MGAVLLFNLHDDIRHVVVANASGGVESIGSRARATWPEDLIKQFSGLMASIIFGICEKVENIAGAINYIEISYEKMKLFIVKGRERNKFYIISARKSIPPEVVSRMIDLVEKL